MTMIINWLVANAATIAVTAVLLLIIALVVFKMVKDKKSGKSSCGCGCEGCALSEQCKGGKGKAK